MARCAVRAAYQRRNRMPEDGRSARWYAGGDIRSAMSLPLLASLLWSLDASALGSTVDKLAILMTIE